MTIPTSRSYCFTYYKMPELIIKYLTLLSVMKKFRYVVAQREVCPNTQRVHIQGYIEFTNKQSQKEIKKLMPGIHLEVRKGTRDQARKYCMKDDTRLLNSKTIELGEFKTEQGKRRDIDIIKDAIKSGKSLKKVVWEDAVNLQTIRIAEKLVQYRQTKRNPNNPPEIRWYYGETGTGKTRSVYDEFETEEIYQSSRYRWWDGYEQQKIILIDDMRKDYAKFHELIKLLDRYPLQVEVKGGVRQINSKIIIITSAYHPKHIYNTREDIQQLIRRITVIKQFGNYKNPTCMISDDENDNAEN